MGLQQQHTILFVDDETSILKSLKRLFRREGYTLLTAENAKEGLERLTEVTGNVSVIISDQRMPEMNGAQFLEKSKAIAPNAVRFLLTGYSDMDAAVEAINKGEIHRYLSKPWNDDELRMHVRSALQQYELKLENQRLNELTAKQNEELKQLNENLEQRVTERTQAILFQNKKLETLNLRLENSFTETIRLLTSLIETVNPKLGAYMKHTAQIAKEIAQGLDLENKLATQIETAALLHDIGLLGLPTKSITKDPKLMDQNETESYRQHPVLATLSVADNDGPVVEIQILYPESQALQEPQARPVLQAGDKPVHPGHVAEHMCDFFRGQHHRESARLLGPHHLVDFPQRPLQDPAIQENERIQSLVLGTRRDVLVHGHVGEEFLDLCCPYLQRVLFLVEQDRTLDPRDVDLSVRME